MAARSAETDYSGSRRARAICAIAAVFVLGLGLWRGAEIFTAPAQSSAPISADQQSLLSLLEPLAGPGNVRVSVRKTGKHTHSYFVQIDTANGGARGLGQDIEAMLVSARGFDAALGDTLQVKEFQFAKGATARPDSAELIELGVLGLLIIMLAWGAFVPARRVPEVRSKAAPKRSVTDTPQRARPVAVDLGPPAGSKSASAAQAASDDPEGTAKIIRAWMRAPEDRI